MFITAVCFIFLIKLRWPKTKSLYDTECCLLRCTPTNLCNEDLCLSSYAVPAIFATLACHTVAVDCFHRRLFLQRSAGSQRIVPNPL